MPRASRSSTPSPSASPASSASPGNAPDAPSHAPRALWKGAISFGLVHIPIALHPATSEHAIDFDWLDRRTLDPVGYKRINKRTGREIPREQIVKGIARADGRYVVIGDDEIAAAYPTTTRTIEIEGFVPADAIPFIYLERPYYVAPIGKADKAYALLREALLAAGRVGVARVVIQNRQHLAVLVPSGPGLVLDLLRWGADIRSWRDLPLPAEGAEAAGLSGRELRMAARLVEDMSTDWQPDAYRDSFKEAIMKLVDHKVAAGETLGATALEAAPDPTPGEAPAPDLADLLRRSLRRKGSATAPGTARAARRPGSSVRATAPDGAAAAASPRPRPTGRVSR